jgi:hypothetical protein
LALVADRRIAVTDYLFLMHDDAPGPGNEGRSDDWGSYIGRLRASGNFQGGSAIGDGVCVRKSGPAPIITSHLSGFIRVSASNLDDARILLDGNPVFEAGGTVEIRQLPRTD